MSAIVYETRNGKAAWGGRLLREWVDDIVALIRERFDPVKVILFGSVADGTDGPDSDLDLLVILDDAPREERRQIMVDLRRATRSAGVPRDLLVTSATDFEKNRSVVGTTEYRPATTGIVVYEREPAS